MESMRAHYVLVFLILLLLGATAPAARKNPPGRRVLIGFRSDIGPQTPAARASAIRQAGGVVHRSPALVPVVAATLSEAALKTWRARRDVAYVEGDVILHALGQTVPWGVDRIDADLAWPAGNTGKGVKVAILDSGIDATHPDLVLAGGVNYAGWAKDGSTNPADWTDKHGHGTHVAGIVAARNNDIGVVGVAPEGSLWAVKVLGDDGTSIGVDTQGSDGWSVSWDTTRSADGQHLLTATAKDTAGQTASHSIVVTVRNTTPGQAGVISVRSITYNISWGRLGTLDLDVAVSVVDRTGKPVANAYVWANLYWNGRIFMTPVGTTNAAGAFLFKAIQAPAGIYKTAVVRVTAQGQTWDGVTPPNGLVKPF